jgi:hypothetical protein
MPKPLVGRFAFGISSPKHGFPGAFQSSCQLFILGVSGEPELLVEQKVD